MDLALHSSQVCEPFHIASAFTLGVIGFGLDRLDTKAGGVVMDGTQMGTVPGFRFLFPRIRAELAFEFWNKCNDGWKGIQGIMLMRGSNALEMLAIVVHKTQSP